MSDLSKEQAYVKIIQELYGSSIHVDEYMISDEVISMVHTILNEIRKCNKNSAVFTATFNALADALETTWKNFDIADPKQFLEDFFAEDKNIFNKQYAAFGAEFMTSFVKQWFWVLTNQRQARICVVVAARNYKSALALSLLGL